LAKEGVGHHQAEHGVTEELQTLVGGQSTFFVGVGTVGQRTQDDLGVDVDPHGFDECFGFGRGELAGHAQFTSLVRPRRNRGAWTMGPTPGSPARSRVLEYEVNVAGVDTPPAATTNSGTREE